MKALLIGATGATGKDLLEQLLLDNDITQVDIFVRRNVDIKHEKLRINIIDFDKYDQWQHLVKGDVLFSCLGTTLKDAGSHEAQYKVDYQYQFNFANAAYENKVNTYVLLSSDGASSKSTFFYTKIKGKLEDDVLKLNFPKTIIFNPPLLIRKNTNRLGEIIFLKVLNFFNAIGLFKSSRAIPTELLAQSMLRSIKKLNNGIHNIKKQDILNL